MAAAPNESVTETSSGASSTPAVAAPSAIGGNQRTRRFLEGALLGIGSQVLMAAAAFFVTPFLLRSVQHDELGVWMMLAPVLGYIGLLDFGVMALLPREISILSGRREEDGPRRISEFAGLAVTLSLWLLPVIALGAVVVCWLSLPDFTSRKWLPLDTIILTFLVAFPLRVYPAMLTGLQELRFMALVGNVSWAIGTVFTVVLVWLGAGLWGLVPGACLTQVVTPIASYVHLRRRFPALLPRPPRTLEWPKAWEILSRSMWLTIANIAHLLRAGTDVLLVGRLAGPTAVITYTCTTKLLGLLAGFPQQICTVAQPGLGELRGMRDHKALVRVSTALGDLMLLSSGAIALAVVAVNARFTVAWVGGPQYGGMALTLCSCAVVFLRHFCQALNSTLYVHGHERLISTTLIIDSILSTAIMVPLIRYFGGTGAALGSLVGVLLVSLPCGVVAMQRLLDIHWRYTLGSLFRWTLRSIPVGVAIVAADRVMPNGWLGTFGMGAVAGLCYLAVTVSVLRSEPLASYLQVIGGRWSRLVRFVTRS